MHIAARCDWLRSRTDKCEKNLHAFNILTNCVFFPFQHIWLLDGRQSPRLYCTRHREIYAKNIQPFRLHKNVKQQKYKRTYVRTIIHTHIHTLSIHENNIMLIYCRTIVNK